jgi:hypothetical protein
LHHRLRDNNAITNRPRLVLERSITGKVRAVDSRHVTLEATESKENAMLTISFGFSQNQATRDAQTQLTPLSQQIRDQINAAREGAQAAAKDARAAAPTPGTPGSDVTTGQQIPWNPNDDIPPRAMGLGIAFLVTVAAVLILMPFTRALSRAIDRSKPRSSVPSDVSAQLNQLGQAVDAIALEVERISEGQRFTTKLLAEQRADQTRTILGAPGADRPPSQ